ncbi:hypothetical protein [Alicyclobacillus sp. SO9]|uniref:hypothetical protein n=1 Tax=Alicyclobacillus sp. SO9 TaxID=2665646 RepID=UPI0018E7D9C1|nr:hypothetical protein [Alicyclobacillus sp. SO9]QQE79052.1 hypothetical protein GI364_00535 [Alicyclobacillus sp. SO9]
MSTSDVENVFSEVLTLWDAMKTSSPDEAAADADKFQMKFYEMIEKLRDWVKTLPHPPSDLEAAQDNALIAWLVEQMPDPLQIPFETELELILEGTERVNDTSEQS